MFQFINLNFLYLLTEWVLSQVVQGSVTKETGARSNCRPSCIRGPSKVIRNTFPSSSMIIPVIPATSNTRDVAASTSGALIPSVEARLTKLTAEWKSRRAEINRTYIHFTTTNRILYRNYFNYCM